MAGQVVKKKRDARKRNLEARIRCDARKREAGLVRKNVWVPKKAEDELAAYVQMLCLVHGID